jgi:signal transduction histidine kinase
VERHPAEHPAAPSPPSPGGIAPVGRMRGAADGPGGTATLQRPAGRPDQDAPGGATAVPRPPRSGPSFAPRHWRVRTKLAAVLLVPAIAFLVLASINMAGQISSAREYGRGATIAEFGRQASILVDELQGERDRAAGYIAAGRPKSNQPTIDKQVAAAKDKGTLPVTDAPNEGLTLATQQKNVDGALAAYRTADASLGDVGPEAKAAVEAARAQLDGLPQLRNAVSRQLLTQPAIAGKYTGIITALRNVNRQIGQNTADTDLNGQVAGLVALSDFKETLSQERSLLYGVLSAPPNSRFQFSQQSQFASAIAQSDAALRRFRADAPTGQVTQFDAAVNGQAILAVKRLEQTVSRAQDDQVLQTLDASQWYSASNTYLTAIRQVESGLLDQVVATTRDLRSDAQRQAITTGVVIAAILVLAFLTSLLIARSMLNPLRRLQAGARDVAEVRLPEAIARLQRPDASAVPDRVEPIGIDSRDEIGEVAKTFDQLHQRAVELASEQAGLRRNVNDMFVNLSRRSQGLVERQLKLIDELETGEQDPDQLANLFKLDHLATRMRRNSENLLVLAGEDAGRRWGRPIPLVDVLRAATSEVEQYHRIQLTGVPDVEVMGHGVNHLVHLVAELLENATVFSSPESKVLVHSQRLSDGGAMVEIEDRGIGMSAHEISDSNERLANPPEFDVSVSRMMGLYVVGRLATRHGITVRLRQSETGGVSAFVRVPVDVLANRFEQRGDETVVGGPPAQGGPLTPTGSLGDVRALDPRAARPPLPAGPGPVPPTRGLPVGAPGAGPAADLPRRPLARPDQPAAGPGGPGGAPLPRRTPAAASGGDGASAGTVDGLPVNGIPGGNGLPARPVPPAVNGNGQHPAAPLPMRGQDPARPDGPPADGLDGRPRDGQSPDGRFRDGQSPDGQFRDGPVRDGQLRDGQVRDGQPVDGQARDGQLGNGQVRDGQLGNGQPGNGQVRDGQLGFRDGLGQDGQVRDGQVRDGQVRDGQVRDGQVRDGQPFGAQAFGGRPADGQPAPLPQRPVGGSGALPFGGRTGGYGLGPAEPAPAGVDEPTPIFEQLQSEWFRQRPATPRTPAATPGAPAARPAAPVAPAAAQGAAAPAPAAAAAAPAQAPAEAWASPADEGWRAAEKLLQPASGGTTRAGLPMRVPQANLLPGGADSIPAAPAEPARPAYRSPEAVRSRLASYHQGVRRGRHADRPDGAGDNRADQSELVQQSQEQS